MNREGMMKAYAILIGLALILFAFFFLKKGFVGKNVTLLDKVNAQIEASSHPVNAATPVPGATPAAEATPAAVAGVTPVPAVTPAPAATPTPAPTAALPQPAKGGMGDAMKKIIERRDNQRKQLENSLNPTE